MPTLTQLTESFFQITITEKEVEAERVSNNYKPTVGQTIQDMLTITLGMEPKDQYWISAIKGAVDASWSDEGRYWTYVYDMQDSSELIL